MASPGVKSSTGAAEAASLLAHADADPRQRRRQSSVVLRRLRDASEEGINGDNAEDDDDSSSSDEEEQEEEDDNNEPGCSSTARRHTRSRSVSTIRQSHASAARAWFRRQNKNLSKRRKAAFGSGTPKLPPGVERPRRFIEQGGSGMVEPKVWLANERTYTKWLQVTVLSSAMTIGLYNAAGPYNHVARYIAYIYFMITIFTGVWGYGIFMHRGKIIRARSGKHLDSPLGPIVVCVAVLGSILINYYYDVSLAIKLTIFHRVTNWIIGLLSMS